MLGHTSASLEIGDLPILPANMRATSLFKCMRSALRLQVPFPSFHRFLKIHKGSGWELLWRLARLNKGVFVAEILLSVAAAVFYYGPAFFLQKLVKYLENDPERHDPKWGLLWALGLFAFNCFSYLGTFVLVIPRPFSTYKYTLHWGTEVTGQLWSLCSCVIQVRLRIQLNSVLFAKTLVRKDVASSVSTKSSEASCSAGEVEDKAEDEDFSSKAQIMTLMTTDVDRCSEFATHMFTLVGKHMFYSLIGIKFCACLMQRMADSPIEIVIGTIFLYKLLGTFWFSYLGGLAENTSVQACRPSLGWQSAASSSPSTISQVKSLS